MYATCQHLLEVDIELQRWGSLVAHLQTLSSVTVILSSYTTRAFSYSFTKEPRLNTKEHGDIRKEPREIR